MRLLECPPRGYHLVDAVSREVVAALPNNPHIPLVFAELAAVAHPTEAWRNRPAGLIGICFPANLYPLKHAVYEVLQPPGATYRKGAELRSVRVLLASGLSAEALRCIHASGGMPALVAALPVGAKS